MPHDLLPLGVKGHVKVQDDLGNVLVDKCNAVHPQNVARVIARALANEHNYSIYRIAFGNGGTVVDAASTITYRTPNDGQPPDVRTWDSRLYHETYSEIIDDSSASLGVDPGSADANVGTRPGGGSVPASDPTAVPNVSGPGVRSNELGLTSEVVITCVLNPQEPTGQFATDGSTTNTESSFTFDEIGLFTAGAPAINSAGSQDVNVGTRVSTNDTTLLANTQYSFNIAVNGGASVAIIFTTPAGGGSGAGGQILYGDLCEAINTGSIAWGMGGSNPLPGGATVSITDNTTSFPSISGAQTYGYLRFTSPTTGATSSIALSAGTTGLNLFASLNSPTGGVLMTAKPGVNAGLQNSVLNPTNERERLLTHLIFSPVLKSANRTLTVTYTLTISVARTQA